MINVLINGINGKMGQEVYNAILNSEDFKTVCGIDLTESSSPIPVYNDFKNIKGKIDIIIDFSRPQATINALNYALEKNIPIVIATTGFTDGELNIIKNASEKIPIFKSSNMSYEVNLMADIVSKLAKQLENSDIEIIETHHRNKVDSPSGTALILADSINSALENKMNYQYNRQSIKQKRPDNEIGIHSIRGGTEVGKHSVMFLGENETFEITHTVTSRSIFATGALKAAKFLINKPCSLYSMKDLN